MRTRVSTSRVRLPHVLSDDLHEHEHEASMSRGVLGLSDGGEGGHGCMQGPGRTRRLPGSSSAPLLRQGPPAEAWKAPAEAEAAGISLLLGRNWAVREPCPGQAHLTPQENPRAGGGLPAARSADGTSGAAS
ncbi:hypothetical protein VULLAG_LOCUS21797 [Vulpes lagopus]